MNLFDILLGNARASRRSTRPATALGINENEVAIERYDLLMRTAPTEMIEKVHAEAFAKLTPEQRNVMFDTFFEKGKSPPERPSDAQPETLARTATKAELEQPGVLSRLFGGKAANPDSGAALGNSLLATFVGYAIGSELALAYLTVESFAADSDGAAVSDGPGFFGAHTGAEFGFEAGL